MATSILYPMQPFTMEGIPGRYFHLPDITIILECVYCNQNTIIILQYHIILEYHYHSRISLVVLFVPDRIPCSSGAISQTSYSRISLLFQNIMLFQNIIDAHCTCSEFFHPLASACRRQTKHEKTKCVSNDRSRHDDSNGPKIIKIGAFLGYFRPC